MPLVYLLYIYLTHLFDVCFSFPVLTHLKCIHIKELSMKHILAYVVFDVVCFLISCMGGL